MSIPSTSNVQMDTYGYLEPNMMLETVSEDAGYLIPNQGPRGTKLTFENSDCDSNEVIASLYSGINNDVRKYKLEDISETHEEVSK